MMRRRQIMMGSGLPQIEWNGADFNWTTGYYLGQTNNGTAGQTITTSYYKAVLDFIPCDALADRTVMLLFSGNISNVIVLCAFYSADNESSYIADSALTPSKITETVPSNARYCRFAVGKNYAVEDFYLRTT